MLNTTFDSDYLAADRAIRELREAGPRFEEYAKPVCDLISSLASIVSVSVELHTNQPSTWTAALSLILEAAIDQPNLTQIAPILLRALPHCTVLRDEQSLRVTLVRLMETKIASCFPDSFFKHQNHIIIQELVNAQMRAESDLDQALAYLQSLEQVGACQQQLMKSVSKRPNRDLFHPFFPENFAGLLKEFFLRLSNYADTRNDSGVAESYMSFVEAATTLSSALKNFGTQLSLHVELQLVCHAVKIAGQDFRDSPATKPASLVMSIGARNYPLHITNHSFALPIVLTNGGPGLASNVKLTAVTDSVAQLLDNEFDIGRIRPGSQERIEVRITVTSPTKSIPILAQVSWDNFDQENQEINEEVTIGAQRTDIDWSLVDGSKAYSLEPVESADELVGRRDMLTRLTSLLQADSAGSALLHGQKRVGKTSLAKALQSSAQALGYIVLYIESGDYVDSSPDTTIRQLCQRIFRMLNKRIELPGISKPLSVESSARLADYLDDIFSLKPDIRILIILDEFDELPLDVYERSAVGNAFFMALRSLSGRRQIGVVIVGGEKIRFVLEKQADKINKFHNVTVDYFNKERDWDDYLELVRRPTIDLLEFDTKAVDAIYEMTSGNPYFTHLLCKHLLQEAISRKDCVITTEDVERSTDNLIRETERNSFQHFWEDGIMESGRDADERSIQRRRILIALSDSLKKEDPASIKTICAKLPNMIDVEAGLQEFYTRGVVAGDAESGYRIKVPLFQKWLEAHAVRTLLNTFEAPDTLFTQRKKAEDARVRFEEIRVLVAQWPTFKGMMITEQKVQSWLDQFGEPDAQRAMFCLLKGLRFYSQSFVRKKMKEASYIVQDAAKNRLGERLLSAEELVVSYLDGPGKSGADTARLFCDERAIPVSTIVEQASLQVRIADPKIRVLLVVDDFVGTGDSASEGLRLLHDNVAETVRHRDVAVVFIAVVGHAVGVEAVRRVAEELRFGVRVHCCEIINEEAQVFSSKSTCFENDEQRDFAKQIANKLGLSLQRRTPLGFGGMGLAVVFERACPNNSLPILHAESTNPKWVPLFKRI